MAINKVGSKGIQDGSVATVDLAPGTVTNAKLTNSSFTFDGTSISLGGSDSVNLSVSWQSVVTADGSTGTTAVAGNGYFIDTTSATHTITLPSSASIGDLVAIKDYAGTFATNNLTIARNGHNIQGVANDSLISTNRASLVLVYVDSTKGWLYWEEHNVADLQAATFIAATGGTVTTSGDYKIHSFTGDGCFIVSSTANPVGGPNNVDYLVVAGGGGGGGRDAGGGGGAGGMRLSTSGYTCGSPIANPTGITVSATTYPITVGAGGAAGAKTDACSTGGVGSSSSFSTITSAGGGGGNGPNTPAGLAGGSGGGGRGGDGGSPGGAGNTPPTSPPQGNFGAPASPSSNEAAGGGGGAGNCGSPTPGTRIGGDGGIGSYVPSSFGSPYGDTGPVCGAKYFAGGGGGGAQGSNGPSCGGAGGAGGGGDAEPTSPTSTQSCAGAANSGGGGGGGSSSPRYPGGFCRVAAGAGGKGIVIIRYKFQ